MFTRRTHSPFAGLAQFVLLFVSLPFTGCTKQESAAPTTKAPTAIETKSSGGTHAVIETDKGEIEIAFFPDAAPKAVENFRLLAERGYYNGLTFHRIVKGFMIQGGDPKGDGTGGESAWGGTFADEIARESALYQRGAGYKRGIVAMANAGPNTNTSQFFILHQDYPLPPAYVIFAKVTRGIEVVDTLAATPTKRGSDGGMSQPLTPPVIKRVTIKP
jgi:cyclophilin family peptidyl-prolyl cis-trans isomerase